MIVREKGAVISLHLPWPKPKLQQFLFWAVCPVGGDMHTSSIASLLQQVRVCLLPWWPGSILFRSNPGAVSGSPVRVCLGMSENAFRRSAADPLQPLVLPALVRPFCLSVHAIPTPTPIPTPPPPSIVLFSGAVRGCRPRPIPAKSHPTVHPCRHLARLVCWVGLQRVTAAVHLPVHVTLGRWRRWWRCCCCCCWQRPPLAHDPL